MRIDLEMELDSQDFDAMFTRIYDSISDNALVIFMNGVMGPELRKRAASRFANEGDDASGPWASLGYVSQKIREWGIQKGHYPGISPQHPINQRTGELKTFVTGAQGDVILNSGGVSLAFPGIGQPSPRITKKLKTAQHGTARGPKRPVLAVSGTDMAIFESELMSWVIKGGR